MNETSKPTPIVSSSAPRVLVVEDETDVALLISYNLEAEGYVVESVASGDEAELKLAESPPDLAHSRTGCCLAFQASRFAGVCDRASRPAACR